MKLVDLEQGLSELHYRPLTSKLGGALLHQFVQRSEAAEILELGFAHGTSTAYLAAALDELGHGTVTTIDLHPALERKPNLHEVLRHLGLERYVHPVTTERSYNWELLRIIESRTSEGRVEPSFDFCFVDGAHTWTDDGLAFFLVDKLLREDRWIVFDDLHWRYAASPCTAEEEMLGIPDVERETEQIAKVFELLVRQHPSYSTFREIGDYGWAYKHPTAGERRLEHVVDSLVSSDVVAQLAGTISRAAHAREESG